jgi:hypothetical protein
MHSDQHGGLAQRRPETTQRETRPADHPSDNNLDLQNIAAETERYIAAAESAIDRVLSAGDTLTFLQGIRQESGQ